MQILPSIISRQYLMTVFGVTAALLITLYLRHVTWLASGINWNLTGSTDYQLHLMTDYSFYRDLM